MPKKQYNLQSKKNRDMGKKSKKCKITTEQIEKIEKVLESIGFKKEDGNLCMPKDENGSTVTFCMNNDMLKFNAENKKRNVRAGSNTNFGRIKEMMDTGLVLDVIIKDIIESVIREVNNEIKCIDIECMDKIKFENNVDILNIDISKSIETGKNLLDLLKEVGAKDAYMSWKLAVILSDLPSYEPIKVDKTDESTINPDMLVGNVSGVNVHIYTNLPFENNTVYYE